jgi:hypothetical protein
VRCHRPLLALALLGVAGCCDPDTVVRRPAIDQAAADPPSVDAVVLLLVVVAGLVGWRVRCLRDDDPMATGAGTFGVAAAGVAGALGLGCLVVAVVAAGIEADDPEPPASAVDPRLAGFERPEVERQGLVTVVAERGGVDAAGSARSLALWCFVMMAVAVAAAIWLRTTPSHGGAAGAGVLLLLAGVLAAAPQHVANSCPSVELQNDGLELVSGAVVASGLCLSLIGLRSIGSAIAGAVRRRPGPA